MAEQNGMITEDDLYRATMPTDAGPGTTDKGQPEDGKPEPTPAERAERDKQERVAACTAKLNALLEEYGCDLRCRLYFDGEGRAQGQPIITAR